MKKVLSFIAVFTVVICSFNMVFAANGYNFDLQYTGTIIKNEEKDASVLLVGSNATAYTNVRIKVDITGPATPRIIATDSMGTQIDIAQTGYWGPDAGFAVGGDFTNTTPIKATFVEEGTYRITLSLIDLTNGNAVIETKTVEIEVFEDDVTGNNIIENNVVVNGIEELPKTGRSIVDYAIYTIGLTLVLCMVGIYLNKKKVNV